MEVKLPLLVGSDYYLKRTKGKSCFSGYKLKRMSLIMNIVR
jgi:hypothetical protein